MGYNSLLDEGDDTPNIEVLERIGWLTEEYNFIPSLSKMERPFIRHYAGFSADVRRKEMPKYALQACFDALEATRSFGQPERGS